MKALSSILVDFDLEDIDEYFTVIKSKVASGIIENISETDNFDHEREEEEDIDSQCDDLESSTLKKLLGLVQEILQLVLICSFS
eukprot:scaffold5316_cov90-Skeletonema_dohrnii-CCMP3373.AAC.3